MEEEEGKLDVVDYDVKKKCWAIVYYSTGEFFSFRTCANCNASNNSVLFKHWNRHHTDYNQSCTSKSCRVMQPPSFNGFEENIYYEYCTNCFERYFDYELDPHALEAVERAKREDHLVEAPDQLTVFDPEERDSGFYYTPIKVTRKLPTYRNSKRAR